MKEETLPLLKKQDTPRFSEKFGVRKTGPPVYLFFFFSLQGFLALPPPVISSPHPPASISTRVPQLHVTVRLSCAALFNPPGLQPRKDWRAEVGEQGGTEPPLREPGPQSVVLAQRRGSPFPRAGFPNPPTLARGEGASFRPA